MTLAVREGIRKGEFDDGARMERLEVTFANRYLTAYDQQVPVIATRDTEAAILGDLVLARNPLFQLMHSEESTDVAGNIRELAQGEFTIATPSRVAVAAKVG